MSSNNFELEHFTLKMLCKDLGTNLCRQLSNHLKRKIL